MYDESLIKSYLRAVYLRAKGMNGPAPEKVLATFLNIGFGNDVTRPILNYGGNRRAYPYLDAFRSVPDSGYGA